MNRNRNKHLECVFKRQVNTLKASLSSEFYRNQYVLFNSSLWQLFSLKHCDGKRENSLGYWSVPGALTVIESFTSRSRAVDLPLRR